MKKTIYDLKEELERDLDLYCDVVEISEDKVERDVCYGKLDIIKKVLDFLQENNLLKIPKDK